MSNVFTYKVNYGDTLSKVYAGLVNQLHEKGLLADGNYEANWQTFSQMFETDPTQRLNDAAFSSGTDMFNTDGSLNVSGIDTDYERLLAATTVFKRHMMRSGAVGDGWTTRYTEECDDGRVRTDREMAATTMADYGQYFYAERLINGQNQKVQLASTLEFKQPPTVYVENPAHDFETDKTHPQVSVGLDKLGGSYI